MILCTLYGKYLYRVVGLINVSLIGKTAESKQGLNHQGTCEALGATPT